MEPFGNGNPEPILKITRVVVAGVRRMVQMGSMWKITLRDAMKDAADACI